MRNSLIDLINAKKSLFKIMDGYVHRFHQARSCYFTKITKSEIIKVVVVGFNFSIRKRLVNQNIANMSQLVDRVRQTKQLHKEREKSTKKFF